MMMTLLNKIKYGRRDQLWIFPWYEALCWGTFLTGAESRKFSQDDEIQEKNSNKE